VSVSFIVTLYYPDWPYSADCVPLCTVIWSIVQSGDFIGGNLHSMLKTAVFSEVCLSPQRIKFHVIRMLGSPVSVRHSDVYFVHMIVLYFTFVHFCYYCGR
jgi:hypothetical protein